MEAWRRSNHGAVLRLAFQLHQSWTAFSFNMRSEEHYGLRNYRLR